LCCAMAAAIAVYLTTAFSTDCSKALSVPSVIVLVTAMVVCCVAALGFSFAVFATLFGWKS